MRKAIATTAALVLTASTGTAGVINVEFKFTPFVGDPATQDQVETVAGVARVFLNDVPYAEQEVQRGEVPVLFDEREIAASVWLPAESCGPALRKGKNTIRIEFDPEDSKTSYRAQLRWASVLDETIEESEGGRSTSTNQAGEGVEEKPGKGKLTMEREFTADFAADLPWHHYPAVTSLSEDDKKALGALVADRAAAFAPDFSRLYAMLEGNPSVDAAAIKASKCFEAAHKAGLRIGAPAPAEVEFVTTGRPEVVIRARKEQLFFPVDPSAFEKIEGDEVQMAVGMALSAVYPPRLVVVKSPSGAWEVVY